MTREQANAKRRKRYAEREKHDRALLAAAARRAKARREADPDAHRAYQREWVKRPHARAAANARARKATAEGRPQQHDPEAVRAAKRRYRERNPQAHRNHQAARRARLRAVRSERVDAAIVLIRDSGICGICGLAVGPDWHLDHVIALVNGGEHSYANVQVSHPSCNSRKGVR